MQIGRIKIWFRERKMTLCLGRKGLFKRIFGQEVIRWLIKPKYKGNNRGGIQVSHTIREAKDFAKKDGKIVSDYGYTTYWIWRFMLTIHTPEYHLKNPW